MMMALWGQDDECEWYDKVCKLGEYILKDRSATRGDRISLSF